MTIDNKAIDNIKVKFPSQPIIKYLVFILGLIIGIMHLKVATKALFVFIEAEPASTWILVLFGPGSTFPAVLVSFFWPRIGGIWLIGGSIISIIAASVGLAGKGFEGLIGYFIKYSGPMLLLGIVVFAIGVLGKEGDKQGVPRPDKSL